MWEEHKTGHDELDYCKHTTEKLMLPVVWQLLRFITIKDNTLLCKGKKLREFKKKIPAQTQFVFSTRIVQW